MFFRQFMVALLGIFLSSMVLAQTEISQVEIKILSVTNSKGKSEAKPFSFKVKRGEVVKHMAGNSMPKFYLAAYFDGDVVHLTRALGLPHWMVRRAKIFDTAVPLIKYEEETPIADIVINDRIYNGLIIHN